MLGGLASLEWRAVLRINSVSTEESLEPKIWILLYKMVLHPNPMLGMSNPPFPSVVVGWIYSTLKVAPFHMN
jgi:hypothetical protein